MKHLKRNAAALAATALTAILGAGSASATTLEVGGVTQGRSVSFAMTLSPGSSTPIKDTFGFSSNTCTTSEIKWSTASPFTGATVTGAVSTMTYANCDSPVTVHKGGTLHITHIAGTTNGTVTSSGAEWTTATSFGTLTCVTGAGTHAGTLTGSAAGHATIAINTTLSCSGISWKWIANYTVTSPTGLGVVA